MDVRPAEPEAQPPGPPPRRVSVWVRVRPFVAALTLVAVSFISLHIWDQIGTLSEGTASGVALPRPGAGDVRPVTTPAVAGVATTGLAAAQPSSATPRPSPTPLPPQPTPAVSAAVPTNGVTPMPPAVAQLTATDLVITIVEPTVEPTLEPTSEPTAPPAPTARPPLRRPPATPTAAPRLPSRPAIVPTARPVVTRPPVMVPPPVQPTPVPTAWRVPVQTPGNWTRPRATPAP